MYSCCRPLVFHAVMAQGSQSCLIDYYCIQATTMYSYFIPIWHKSQFFYLGKKKPKIPIRTTFLLQFTRSLKFGVIFHLVLTLLSPFKTISCGFLRIYELCMFKGHIEIVYLYVELSSAGWCLSAMWVHRSVNGSINLDEECPKK